MKLRGLFNRKKDGASNGNDEMHATPEEFVKIHECLSRKRNFANKKDSVTVEKYEQIVDSLLDMIYVIGEKNEDECLDFLRDLEVDDLKFFRFDAHIYSVIIKNFEKLIKSNCMFFNDFELMREYFPEIADMVYEYMFKVVVIDGGVLYNINLIDEVLIPMADLETYQNCYFNCIREKYEEILRHEAVFSYKHLFDVYEVLSERFGVSKDLMDLVIENIIDCQLVEWKFDGNRQIDKEELENFFVFPYAYEVFMNNLPELLHNKGLKLYATLISLRGLCDEVVRYQKCCYEYDD